MSNFIKISNKYAIASDARQWMVQKYSPRKDDKPDWQSISFHGKLSQAVKSLGEHLLMTSGSSSVTELVGAATDISRMLSKSFTVESEVKYPEDLK